METNLSPWYQKFIIDGKPTTRSSFMSDELFSNIEPLLTDDLTGKIVLDLGCNAGLVSFKLAERGAKVIAFDRSEHYIDQANYVMRKLMKPRVRFIMANIEDLAISFYRPYLVVALSVIYHLKDPAKMIEKISNSTERALLSFRLSNADKLTKRFEEAGMKVTATANYAKKRAVYFTKP